MVKSIAIIGAGAAGAATAAAFKAENYFDKIQVFERREKPGGTWIYDADPQPSLAVRPGKLPAETDPPLKIPDSLPAVLPPEQQERFSKTPVYNSLTTNVPDIAMSFSDRRFAYGPFAPHYIPRLYIEDYFAHHKTDSFLVLNTTVEDITKLPPSSSNGGERWKLTLRKHDPGAGDLWWEETFDAVILANGHYAVPFVPQVRGLEAYIEKFPGRVVHSKYYRSPSVYSSKKLLIIGNSASGKDLTTDLLPAVQLPIYQSRRSKSRWDGRDPPLGVVWKPIIKEFKPDGRIVFEDDTHLDGIDTVIYCTGYKVSFPFWNEKANGRPLYDYAKNKLIKGYWHTFFQDFTNLAVVGIPRVLTFRSFEYQAIALARLFSGRNSKSLPPIEQQQEWERDRLERVTRDGLKFHDIQWETGETKEWLQDLYEIAGLGTLLGDGITPPVLGKDLVWALEHVKKYPEPDEDSDDDSDEGNENAEWVLVEKKRKDLLAFI